jgi:Asp-tRNA(Asn)/Glu-tRNA(Gln) amidotransferase A subunit family amidase
MKTISAIHDALDGKKASAVEIARDYFTRARADQRGAYLAFCDEKRVLTAHCILNLSVATGTESSFMPEQHPPFLARSAKS